MAAMKKSEELLWECVVHTNAIIAGLKNLEAEYEHDRYTDGQREDFAFFRQSVMFVLGEYNSHTISDYDDWRRINEQEAGK